MLKRIKIKGYKSFKDAEIRLTPLSVLMGPNAAGKSNFLDALQLLSRIAVSSILKDAFEPPYRGKPLESFTFGSGGLRSLIEKGSSTFSLEVDVELPDNFMKSVNRQILEMRRTKPTTDGRPLQQETKQLSLVREKLLRYRIEIEILPKSGILRVTDEHLVALKPNGEPTKKRKPFLEKMGERLHLRMEGQAHPTYYDPYLPYSILSQPLYPPYYPHITAMRQELASWLFFYFEPRERMRAPNPVKEVRHIGLMGEDLAAFLNTVKALDENQFKAIKKALRVIIPSVTDIEVSVNQLGEVELKLFEGKTPIPARLLSEGTLRVLGLLALRGAKDVPGLIGFEEPENGIHPRRIQLISEFLKDLADFGDTQLIVTTHSPILPKFIPSRKLYVCAKEEGYTVIKPLKMWNVAGSLAKEAEVGKALDAEEEFTVTERILRGDFDS
ncbi:AAA family ATPase [candidate division WOR-3 bacterium]|nr:AAA family ATPase [candidate division WOR-3 bacterium]